MGESLPVPADETGLLIPGLATDHPAAKKMMRRLSRKTPKSVIKHRPGPMVGGQRMQFAYIPWPYVARTLNEVFGPTWGRQVLSMEQVPMPDRPAKHDLSCDYGRKSCAKHKARKSVQMVAHVRITTPWSTQDAIGAHLWFPDNPEVGPGDAQQSAVSKGMVRAAANLGIGLDLKTELPDEVDMEADFAQQDARGAWKSALRQHGLTQTAAVSILSERLAQDKDALNSLDDCLAATGLEGADAYWKLIDELGKEGESETA